MLNHNHGIAHICQPIQNLKQFPDVIRMKSGGRFIQNINRFAGGSFAQLSGELDPLRLAAGERSSRLTDADISQPDIRKRLVICSKNSSD